MQLLGGPADVDDDVVGVERRPPERRVDDVRRAVQPLRRSEDLAAEAVGDHHVVADGHAEHAASLLAVGDACGKRRQAPVGEPGHHVGQLVEAATRR